MDKDRITVAINRQQYEQIKKIANKNFRSITGQIKFMLAEYLNQNQQ